MKVKCISSFYILNKGVFNKGDIIELDKEIARKLIKDGKVVEYIENVKEEKIDYNDLTIKELKEILKNKNLSVKGNKAELVKRLEEN
jgi:hypothetical protein